MSSHCSEDLPHGFVVVVTGIRSHPYVPLLCVMCPAVSAVACILSDSACSWGCICTSYLARDYARVRLLSWYLVSHDRLCTTIQRRTIVLAIRPRSADAPWSSTKFYYY